MPERLSRAQRVLRSVGATGLIAATCAAPLLATRPAIAAGPGLPRTYDFLRVDSPNPGANDTFAFGIVNGGDLDGDGEDDVLASQGTRILSDGTGAEDGEMFVISGDDGSTIRSLPAPEPDTNAGGNDRAAAFGFYLGRIGQDTAAPPFTDLGSCPGGDGPDPGVICDALIVGGADGVPDILASALHVDRDTPAAADGVAEDIGRVYVIDGATFAVLKRLDMPQADVDDLADETERLTPAGAATPARPWFGRTVLNPAGTPPCDGHGGVGPCQPVPGAVALGDLDGGGAPDVVVGASGYKFEEADDQAVFGQSHAACDDTAAVDTCIRSGRVYMFRGEDIVASDPAATLENARWNIKNPFAQADVPQTDPESTRIVNQLELWGHSVAPVGDIGRCGAAVDPGDKCPPANVSGTPDGLPEVLVSAFRVDYPTAGPDNDENFDIGVNAVLDGGTGAILQVFKHPDPDPGSIFGFQITSQPAVGDMGGSPVPDVVIPAGGQDTDDNRGEGVAFVMNGAAVVSGNIIDIQRFRDPVPNASGSFGTTIAGVGDLAGDTRNEVLIGEFSGHNPPQNDRVVGDVHFFDPITGDALQTVRDPDRQPGSTFGVGLAPLGDLNEDGFLDFAASAPRYDHLEVTPQCAAPPCQDVGRLYIFTSQNLPPTTVQISEGGLAVQAAPATANNILVTRIDADTIRVSDRPDAATGAVGAPVEPGTGCERVDGHTVDCDATAIFYVFVDAGGGDDVVVNDTEIDSTIFGRGGDDTLAASGGFDFLSGGRGDDDLGPGASDDGVFAGRGDDTVAAGAGNDFVRAGRGTDRLHGGSGDDDLRARDDAADAAIDCGAGAGDGARIDVEDPRPARCEDVRRR